MATALVIDNDRAISESLCQLLGLLDIAARPAYNTHAALLTLMDATPDLIFLSDEQGQGMEFLEFLQAESELSSIPVVLLVGSSQHFSGDRTRPAGILDVVQRPAPLEAIERVLQKAGVV